MLSGSDGPGGSRGGDTPDAVKEAVGEAFGERGHASEDRARARKDAKDSVLGQSTANQQPGDEDRALLHDEIRRALTEGLSALGGFDPRSSAVTIVPSGASTFHGPIAGRDIILDGQRDTAVLSPVSIEAIN
jgi:hypothetical protein